MASNRKRLGLLDDLESVSRCISCKETFIDPRNLPCGHVFCLKCLTSINSLQPTPADLARWGRCTTCRKGYAIPAGGIDDFPKNFILEMVAKMIRKTAEDVKRSICYSCAQHSDNSGEAVVPEASKLCVYASCRKFMCDACCDIHRQDSGYHYFSEFRQGDNYDKTRNKQPCCFKCCAFLCGMCVLKLQEINATACLEDIEKIKDLDIEKLISIQVELEEAAKDVKDKETQYNTDLKNARIAIRARGAALKDLIIKQENSLLEELNSIETQFKDEKAKMQKGLEIVTDDLRRLKTGSKIAIDMCQRLNGVHMNLEEKLQPHRRHQTLPVRVSFTVPFDNEELLKTYVLFGKITVVEGDERQATAGQELAKEMKTESQNTESQNRSISAAGTTVRAKDESKTFHHLTSQTQRRFKTDADEFSDDVKTYLKYLQILKKKVLDVAEKSSSEPSLGKEEIDKFNQQLGLLNERKKYLELNELDEVNMSHAMIASILSNSQIHKQDPGNMLDMLIKLEQMVNDMVRVNLQQKKPADSFDANANKFLKIPRGIRHLGNTCYFNSVMQCLCHSHLLVTEMQDLINNFRRIQTTVRLASTEVAPLSRAFFEFLTIGYDSSSEEALQKLLRAFYEKSPRFSDRRQHDSHDLLIHLLDGLRAEERQLRPKHSDDQRNTLTLIEKVFGGQFITVYCCHTCGGPYVVFEPRLDISLPICPSQTQPTTYDDWTEVQPSPSSKTVAFQRNADNDQKRKKDIKTLMTSLNPESIAQSSPSYFLTVNQCLFHYTKTEQLRDDYLCLACQPKKPCQSENPILTPAIKRTLIHSPPAILVLHIKRFEHKSVGFVKQNKKVEYNEFLDIGPFCSSDCRRLNANETNVWYSLYGVVVHTGSLEVGHCVAYVKNRQSTAKELKKFLPLRPFDKSTLLNPTELLLMNAQDKPRPNEEWHPSPMPGQWYYTSDETVYPVDIREVLCQEAFLLFYERVGKP